MIGGFKYLHILHILRRMVNITLSMPDEVRNEMKDFPDINWSVVARMAIVDRIKMLKKFRSFNKDSEMTEEDAVEFGRKVKKRK